MLLLLRKSISLKIGFSVGLACLAVTLVGLAWMMLTGNFFVHNYLQLLGVLLLVGAVTLITVLMTRLILTQPLRNLTRAIELAEGGDFLTRVEAHGLDELGRLAADFNKLLTKLTDIQASKIDTDIELNLAQRELKFKAQLEEKNRIIQETNRMLTRRLDDLALLYDVNQALSSNLELNQVLKVITEKIGNTLGFDELTILLMDEERHKLEIRSVLGKRAPSEPLGRLIDPMYGFFAEAARKQRNLVVGDLLEVTLEGDDQKLLPPSGSFLSIPMIYKNRILGLLNFTRPEKNAFSSDEIQLLTSVAQQAAMAILNAQLYQEKLDLSITDELTKLANRRLLQTRLELEWNRAGRFKNPMSLLMVDIDHFKWYNDINGHLLGDKVLRGVARILADNTRNVDTVARFGGEEFVVILPGQNKIMAVAVADKLRRGVFNTHFPRAHRQPSGHLTISVGVATYPDDADDPHRLLDLSDLALYVAKRTGRDMTVAYEKGMEQVEEERRLALQEKKARRRKRRRHRSKFASAQPA